TTNTNGSLTISLQGPIDPSAADVAAGLHYALVCDGSSLAGVTYATASTSNSRICNFANQNANNAVRARIIDKDDGFTEYQATVNNGGNQPPSVSVAAGFAVDEGGSVQLTATGSDPENGALVYKWDLDN